VLAPPTPVQAQVRPFVSKKNQEKSRKNVPLQAVVLSSLPASVASPSAEALFTDNSRPSLLARVVATSDSLPASRHDGAGGQRVATKPKPADEGTAQCKPQAGTAQAKHHNQYRRGKPVTAPKTIEVSKLGTNWFDTNTDSDDHDTEGSPECAEPPVMQGHQQQSLNVSGLKLAGRLGGRLPQVTVATASTKHPGPKVRQAPDKKTSALMKQRPVVPRTSIGPSARQQPSPPHQQLRGKSVGPLNVACPTDAEPGVNPCDHEARMHRDWRSAISGCKNFDEFSYQWKMIHLQRQRDAAEAYYLPKEMLERLGSPTAYQQPASSREHGGTSPTVDEMFGGIGGAHHHGESQHVVTRPFQSSEFLSWHPTVKPPLADRLGQRYLANRSSGSIGSSKRLFDTSQGGAKRAHTHARSTSQPSQRGFKRPTSKAQGICSACGHLYAPTSFKTHCSRARKLEARYNDASTDGSWTAHPCVTSVFLSLPEKDADMEDAVFRNDLVLYRQLVCQAVLGFDPLERNSEWWIWQAEEDLEEAADTANPDNGSKRRCTSDSRGQQRERDSCDGASL
jgi:hypothetical protein